MRFTTLVNKKLKRLLVEVGAKKAAAAAVDTKATKEEE